jgi:hypothetical protein
MKGQLCGENVIGVRTSHTADDILVTVLDSTSWSASEYKVWKAAVYKAGSVASAPPGIGNSQLTLICTRGTFE